MKIMPRSTTRRPPPLTLSTSEGKNLEQKSLIVKSIGEILRKMEALGTPELPEITQLREALRNARFPRRRPLSFDECKRKEEKEMLQAVELLCSSLSQRDLLCLSEQEAADINLELQRLQRMLQLQQVENGSSFKEMQEADKTKYEEVCKILRRPSPYSMELDRQVQETLLELAVPSSCGDIADLELDPIAAALRSWAGRWFRCPKGHPYCVTEEGGAVQDAVCPEAGCAVDTEKI